MWVCVRSHQSQIQILTKCCSWSNKCPKMGVYEINSVGQCIGHNGLTCVLSTSIVLHWRCVRVWNVHLAKDKSAKKWKWYKHRLQSEWESERGTGRRWKPIDSINYRLQHRRQPKPFSASTGWWERKKRKKPPSLNWYWFLGLNRSISIRYQHSFACLPCFGTLNVRQIINMTWLNCIL